MLRKNLKNYRWWVVLVPGLLLASVAALAERIDKGACCVLDWMYAWVYGWRA